MTNRFIASATYLSDATKPLKRDITQRRFKVLSADPKGFDRDGDGIAYER
ncbi:MAG: hypothetical protein HWQ38_18440 [Nostoc sp. NMS7]|nr:hypothetical protein [Nostoc sp. NMS7]MBN3948319.1 hypothetical protein [Nostoc sp. NMS7]